VRGFAAVRVGGVGGRRRLRRGRGLRIWRRRRWRDDEWPEARGRGEDAEISDRVPAGRGNCDGEAREQREGLHFNDGRAIAKRLLEQDPHESVGAELEALVGDGRAQYIFDEGLAASGVVGPGSGHGVQSEPEIVDAQRGSDAELVAVGECDEHGLAACGPGGGQAGDRSGGEGGKRRIAVGEIVADRQHVVGNVDDTAARSGLRVAALSGPLPERPPSPGRRLPHLCAVADREERRAAGALALRTIEAAGHLGAGVVALDLGQVRLRVSETEVIRHFARGECEDGEPGAERLEAALAERKALSPALFDACRYAIEPLVTAALERGLALALTLGASPWRAPTPREALDLVSEFRGSSLGVAADAAKLEALAALGVRLSDERRQALGRAARLVVRADAVGLEHDLLPGLGERTPPLSVPEGIMSVIVGRPDATEAEVAAARATTSYAAGPGPQPVASPLRGTQPRRAARR